jgi:hypothetical protein
MKIATLILLLLMITLSAVPLFPVAPQRDVPGEVAAARQALQTARNELDHAGGEWGGHRVAAIKHIDSALAELAEAEKWAREHHDVK